MKATKQEIKKEDQDEAFILLATIIKRKYFKKNLAVQSVNL
jgi:hypothetical protein